MFFFVHFSVDMRFNKSISVLKERIDTQLVFSKTEHGSSAEFVLSAWLRCNSLSLIGSFYLYF